MFTRKSIPPETRTMKPARCGILASMDGDNPEGYQLTGHPRARPRVGADTMGVAGNTGKITEVRSG